MNFKKRMKNPWFWVGLFGVVLTAIGVDPELFTSWEILVQEAKTVLGNPYLLATACLAVLGVLVDPSTSGISDKNNDR